MKDSGSSRAADPGSVKPQRDGEQDLREGLALAIIDHATRDRRSLVNWAPALTLADAILAILALTADPWRPIETAPRDGTAILIFQPDGGCRSSGDARQHHMPEGALQPGEWSYRRDDPRLQFYDDGRWAIGYWRPWGGWGNRNCSTVEPTHWAPLPPSPRDQQVSPAIRDEQDISPAQASGFVLDTSGVVSIPHSADGYGQGDPLWGDYTWDRLSPFTQGYVEAQFEDQRTTSLDAKACEAFVGALIDPAAPNEALTAASRRYREAVRHQKESGLYPTPILITEAGFSDLAGEALARIIADCRSKTAASLTTLVAYEGKRFWERRQAGEDAYFPPLTVALGDDGRVYLREASEGGAP